MSEKCSEFQPSCPALEVAANQQEAPPPYSPYDPYKQYPQDSASHGRPIGFESVAVPVSHQIGPVGGQSCVYVQPPNQPVVAEPAAIQPYAVQPVIQQVVTGIPLGPDSIRMQCPYCHKDVNTSVVKEPSFTAYISSGILCLLGCIYGCCLLPFCMDSCKVSKHHCPSCDRYLGKFSRL